MDALDRIRSRAQRRARGEYRTFEHVRRGICSLQHDQVIANADGATVRADINAALAALFSQSSGTTNNVLKQRNAANLGWITIRTLDESFVLSRSSNTILGLSDKGKLIRATSGFTQTLTAAATLGDGWFVAMRVESGATVVIDPNSSEQVDGAATLSIVGPSSGWIFCNGTGFYTVGFASTSAASESASGVAEIATQAETDTGTDDARIVTPLKLKTTNRLTLATEQASTSGTSIDFTSIPTGVRRIVVLFNGVSTNGNDDILIQLGDSGGVENAGYVSFGTTESGGTSTARTDGFIIETASANTSLFYGQLILHLQDSSDNTWIASGHFVTDSTTLATSTAGGKALSAVLDRVRITTTGGTQTFDAGSINLIYER
jgi:hypothetical protein